MIEQNLIKITDRPDLKKDPRTGAIINTNNDALKSYKRKKSKFQQIDNMQNRILNLEERLDSIQLSLDLILQQLRG